MKCSCIFILINRIFFCLSGLRKIQTACRNISHRICPVCILIFNPAPDLIYRSRLFYLIKFKNFSYYLSIFPSGIIQHCGITLDLHFFIDRFNLIGIAQHLILNVANYLIFVHLTGNFAPSIVADSTADEFISQ